MKRLAVQLAPAAAEAEKAKRAKVGRKSSRKGANAEREICEKLRAWWAQVEPLDTEGRPIVFVRTPRSGGWTHARSQFKACGDVMTSAPSFPFVVECKRREGWSFDNWVKNPMRSPVRRWWKQACDAADEQGGIPLLLFRKNRADWTALIAPPEDWEGSGRLGDPGWVWLLGYEREPRGIPLDWLLAISPSSVRKSCAA